MARRLAISLGAVGTGVLIGLALTHRLPGFASADDSRMRSVVGHERNVGNGVVEVTIRENVPTTVTLPRGVFAVLASTDSPSIERVTLEAGDGIPPATLRRPSKNALLNVGLTSRWSGPLTLKLTGAPSARLAFFCDRSATPTKTPATR